MRTLRQIVAVSITSSIVVALLATEVAVRNAEDFSSGWRYGLR